MSNLFAQEDTVIAREWRKDHPAFQKLPFYTSLGQSKDVVAWLSHVFEEGFVKSPPVQHDLTIISKGIEEYEPFSDRVSQSKFLGDSDGLLTPNLSVSHQIGRAVWGFFLKYVFVDRYCKMHGVDRAYPGPAILRSPIDPTDVGTAKPILASLQPSSSLLTKFCQLWDTEKGRLEQIFADDGLHRSEGNLGLNIIRLSQSVLRRQRRVNFFNIMSGLELLALAKIMIVENNGHFPEDEDGFTGLLRNIEAKLQICSDISTEDCKWLYTSARNVLDFVFSISPILALSTRCWYYAAINRTFLARIFHRLGNNRPEILITIEDQILHAIDDISRGAALLPVIRQLYQSIESSQLSLVNDRVALNWFCLFVPTENLDGDASSLLSWEETLSPSVGMGIPLLTAPLHDNDSPPPVPSTTISLSPPRSMQSSTELTLGFHGAVTNKNHTLLHVATIDPKDLDYSHTAAMGASRGSTPSAVQEQSQLQRKEESPEPEGQHSTSTPAIDTKETSPEMMSEAEKVPGGTEPAVQVVDEPKNGSDGETELSAPDTHDSSTSRSPSPTLAPLISTSSVASKIDPPSPVNDSSAVPSMRHTLVDNASGGSEDGGLDSDNSQSYSPNGPKKAQAPKRPGNDVIPQTPTQNQGPRTRQFTRRVEGEKRIQQEGQPLAVPSHANKTGSSRKMKRGRTRRKMTAWKGKEKASDVKMAGFRIFGDSDTEDDDEKDTKLSNIKISGLHPSLSADLKLFPSTVEHPVEKFTYIPFEILEPGDLSASSLETHYIQKMEAKIRENDQENLPPHLCAEARILDYNTDSSPSRICVFPYVEYIQHKPAMIQRILRDRHILVHGVPLEHEYGWDIETLGTVWDVDKPTTVQVGHYLDPMKPDARQLIGTLRDVHALTTKISCPENPPPLNAISLPMGSRTLFLPSQWGSIASHEVAQSRAPKTYTSVFDVPDLRDDIHWALVGAKRAFSPLHIDPEGFGTLVHVLYGSKYWMIVTKIGEDDDICSVDSLGANWNPYLINEGDNIERFQFEGVHLKRGDMLIMRPGTLHAALGTDNAICVGRHYYATATIQLSVISIIHSVLLEGSVTNEDHWATRSLLFQLMYMWADRFGNDVDRAHLPDMSSEAGLFDVLFLGVFITLAPALDPRFSENDVPPNLHNEIALAESSFLSLLHLFHRRYFIMLDGEVISHKYVFHRMLAEMAAAAAVFAKQIYDFATATLEDGNGPSVPGKGGREEKEKYAFFKGQIDAIIEKSYPSVLGYYSTLFKDGHRHFRWTGPTVHVFPRSDDCESVLSLISQGELVDFPDWTIYITTTPGAAQRDRADNAGQEDTRPRKRQRWQG